MVAARSLFELQKIDTALLQIAHRQAHLDEHKVLASGKSTLATKQREQAGATEKLALARKEISNLEAANQKCEAQIAKYSQQLRTVSAPREAEALQHEIDSARAERSTNDDRELQLLDETDRLEPQLRKLADEIELCLARVDTASKQLEDALDRCSAEKKTLDEKRISVANAIDAKLIKLYDAKRQKRTTPAVADLHDSKCQSCHLDLSVAELAALKKLGADQLAECPNCDCYLVL